MKTFVSAVSAAVSLVSFASAHGGVSLYTMNGVAYAGWQPYNDPTGQTSIEREYSSYNPLLLADLTTVNIRCNNPGDLGTGLSGTVAAGSTIKATWAQWTHRPASVLVYMAKCPSSGCNSWDGSGTVWFKIDQAGLISGTENAGIWAGDQIVDTLNWTSTVPASLAPGQYLIRHELIAVHQANNPQFYPECAQLTVTGSGTATPSGTFLVSFPGAYSASDPGLGPFDIDSQAAMTSTCYPIPGPAVWPSGQTVTCSGSSGSGTTTAAPTSTKASTTTLATSVTSAAGGSTGGATVAQWGQCGGTGYSGSTICASPYKCVTLNAYYSQCQ